MDVIATCRMKRVSSGGVEVLLPHKRAGELVAQAGQRLTVVDLPQMAHSMHAVDSERFAEIFSTWVRQLDAPNSTH